MGQEALGFCQEYGDTGIAALDSCAPATGKKLVALHESGDLARLAHPVQIVAVIAQRGDPAGCWVLSYHEYLRDGTASNLFLSEPMEYIYGLKNLSREMAKRRWFGAAQLWGQTSTPVKWGTGLAVALVVLFLWRRKVQFDQMRRQQP